MAEADIIIMVMVMVFFCRRLSLVCVGSFALTVDGRTDVSFSADRLSPERSGRIYVTAAIAGTASQA